jgi:hypothetical protein
MALLPCLPLSAAAFNILDIERFIFAALNLGNCGLELVVFALALLQEAKGHADNLGRFLEDAGSYLRVNELLLLRSELDH